MSFDDTSGTGLFDVTHNNVLFDNLVNANTPTPDNLTTVGGSSPIGEVRLTEGDGSTDVIDGRNLTSPFTFDGNASYGSIGSMAPGEDDVFTLNFNDLGVGNFLITLYMGHTADNRSFEMDVSGTGVTAFSDTSGTISALGSTVNYGSGVAFLYQINVTTDASTDDLALTFGSISGSTGEGLLSGYTIAIPEPSSFALMALAGISLFLLRRRIR